MSSLQNLESSRAISTYYSFMLVIEYSFFPDAFMNIPGDSRDTKKVTQFYINAAFLFDENLLDVTLENMCYIQPHEKYRDRGTFQPS